MGRNHQEGRHRKRIAKSGRPRDHELIPVPFMDQQIQPLPPSTQASEVGGQKRVGRGWCPRILKLGPPAHKNTDTPGPGASMPGAKDPQDARALPHRRRGDQVSSSILRLSMSSGWRDEGLPHANFREICEEFDGHFRDLQCRFRAAVQDCQRLSARTHPTAPVSASYLLRP
jgi:hypothetical protein